MLETKKPKKLQSLKLRKLIAESSREGRKLKRRKGKEKEKAKLVEERGRLKY